MFHRRSQAARTPLVVLVGLMLAGPAAAKTAIVYLTDRADPIRGELVSETGDAITLRIAGISTPIPRDRIERIEYELSLTEQYQQRLAEVEDDDWDARYEIARWLFGQGSAEGDQLARQELRVIADNAADPERAGLLLQLVNQRIQARQRQQQEEAAPGDEGPPAAGQPGAEPSDGPDGEEPQLLTDEQINLVKVYEIDLQTEPRVSIPREALLEFLEGYRADPALAEYQGRSGRQAFLRLPGWQQLQVLFQARAREYYDEVVVRDEPAAMQTFRRRIASGLLAQRCARCHGGGEAAGLYLFAGQPNRESVAYTNFLILHRMDLIDRDQPTESRLLQYGLPRAEATHPHPEVDGFQQYFTGPEDPRYQQAVEWVRQLYRPEPNYPIDYRVPEAAGPQDEEPTEQAENGEAASPDGE